MKLFFLYENFLLLKTVTKTNAFLFYVAKCRVFKHDSLYIF